MTIAAAAKLFDLTPDTLRYYERIGLLPPVPRTPGGIRNYGEDDCGWIEFIKCMRSAGLPIEFLVDYVKLFRQGEETTQLRLDMLKEQRVALAGRITEMQASLERLDGKIKYYAGQVKPFANKPTSRKGDTD